MKIIIRTIPHHTQRYDTVGDWQWMQDPRTHEQQLMISVSELPQRRQEYCAIIHELVEAILCKVQGVSESEVDTFDQRFNGEGEPGDDPACPYYNQHQIATAVEVLLAQQIGINWRQYCKDCDQLHYEKNDKMEKPK